MRIAIGRVAEPAMGMTGEWCGVLSSDRDDQRRQWPGFAPPRTPAAACMARRAPTRPPLLGQWLRARGLGYSAVAGRSGAVIGRWSIG
jgi:hypothetical protein